MTRADVLTTVGHAAPGPQSAAARCEDEFRIGEPVMSGASQVQVGRTTYFMPPQAGFSVAHFLTVADIDRSVRFYETVFGGRVLSTGDSSGARGTSRSRTRGSSSTSGAVRPPTSHRSRLRPPPAPGSVSSFMNIRVADIHACYELWRSRGADFITPPKDKYGETRCYIRDPDGYVIEVGESKPGFAYG